MNRAQEHLLALLDNLPAQDLPSDEQRSAFERIKERLATAENLNAELRRLFRVKGFGEAALGMLWVVDQVNRDNEVADVDMYVVRRMRRALSTIDGVASDDIEPPPIEPAAPETNLFGEPTPVSAFSDTPIAEGSADATLDPFGLGPAPAVSEPQPTSEAPAQPEVPFGQTEGLEVAPEPPPELPRPSSGSDDEDAAASPETVFGRVLERFLEAVQVGSDDRLPLLRTLVEKCDAVGGIRDGGEDLRRFTALLKDFLGFIEEQQLLDDVRVMNAISNAEGPYAEWLNAPQGERAGKLDDAIEFLSNAKAMFE